MAIRYTLCTPFQLLLLQLGVWLCVCSCGDMHILSLANCRQNLCCQCAGVSFFLFLSLSQVNICVAIPIRNFSYTFRASVHTTYVRHAVSSPVSGFFSSPKLWWTIKLCGRLIKWFCLITFDPILNVFLLGQFYHIYSLLFIHPIRKIETFNERHSISWLC